MTTSKGQGRGNVRAKLVGLHKATKRLSGGRVAVYAYLYRGGPLIARGEGITLSLANRSLEAALGSQAALKRVAEAKEEADRLKPRQSDRYIYGLVTAFLESAEFRKLGDSSQTAYRHYLERFRTAFGEDRLSMFDKPATVELLTDWRDEMAETPRAADYAIASVAKLFQWAASKGKTKAEPTKNIAKLHKANRSDIIWTDADLNAFCASAPEHLRQAVMLAAFTGLRQGDLLRLPWRAVSDVAITLRTSKRQRVAVVPLLPESRKIIEALNRDSLTVLQSSYGRPWTSDGFRASFRKACAKAKITKRFHDLRGTAATKLAPHMDDADLARWMGWSVERVTELKLLYVNADAVAHAMILRMEQKRNSQTDVQTGFDDAVAKAQKA